MIFKHENISAIILAAGYSSRMGDYKPLMRLGPYRAVEHAVRCFLQAGVCDIRVVVGFRAEELIEVVESLGARAVFNPNFEQGMYSSVQAGVRTLEQDVQAFFVLPVDQPLISYNTVEKILDCSLQGQHGIVYPVFNGRRGHPPLISTRYKDKILHGAYQDGLRGLLNLYEHEAFDIEVRDQAVLLDMDTQEDYHYLLNYFYRRTIPTLDECWQILHEAKVDEHVKEHCCVVAAVALELVEWLNKAGAGLDEDLILAGALLHDIARFEPDHAQTGARLLKSMGYPLVAAVVGAHMDIEVNEDYPLTEAEVVYLADKMVKGKDVISINDRFAASLHRYKDDQQACDAVIKRLQQAERIVSKIVKILGHPAGKILEVGFYPDENLYCMNDYLLYEDRKDIPGAPRRNCQ